MRRLFQLWVVGSLILAVGGHWAILQSVAWTGMVISYSKNAPLSEALQKTFDGKHPCQLCKVVAEGKKSEREQELQKQDTKLELFCASALLAVLSPCSFPAPTAAIHFSPLRVEPPPGPPPRPA